MLFTLNESAEPTVPVAEEAEVMAAASSTTRVKAWVVVPPLFVAFRVRGYEPPVPATAVPEMVADPAAPAWNVTPEGSTPDSVSVGSGFPVALTVKLKGVPTAAVVPADDVNTGVIPFTTCSGSSRTKR